MVASWSGLLLSGAVLGRELQPRAGLWGVACPSAAPADSCDFLLAIWTQALADIRNSLASTTAESAAVQQQTVLTNRQLEAVQASLAAVQGECSALERECSALKQQKEQW